MGALYPSTSKRSEVNLRQELINMFDGHGVEIPKAQKALLRKMRKDENNELTRCDCVSNLTKEPDLDTFCPICWGEGYLWDESWIDVYKISIRSDVGKSTREDLISPGLLNIPIVVFYLKYSVDITSVDKIVELQLDVAGDIVVPYKREYLYRIGELIDMRSDNGRLEYWQADCYAEKRKFLNGPNV